MKHFFLDRYSDRKSVIHQIDPRIKIVIFFTYIIFVILTPAKYFTQFSAYLALILFVAVLSRVPLFYIFKSSLVIIPFSILIAIFIPFFKEGEIAGIYNFVIFQLTVTYNGLWILWNILIKSWLSVFAIIILSSTTKFSDLLKGLEKLFIPRVFLMILSFMYRYIFILMDEAMKMKCAWKSRYFGGKFITQIKVFANIIGLLFIRAFERGERVYLAMCSRGFKGKVIILNPLRVKLFDIFFAIGFLTILFMIKLVEE